MSRIVHRHSRRAFTLVELILGLMVTLLIMSALSAVTLSVSTQWSTSDATQALQLQSVQLQQRLQRLFASAKFVGYVADGALSGSTLNPAQVFYWQADDFNGVADGLPEVGEMALLAYDPATQSIYLYTVPSNLTGAQLTAAGVVMTYAEMSASSAPTSFAALPYITKTCLCGPGANTPAADDPLVTGLRVDMLDQTDPTTSTRVCTTLEFQVGLSRGGLSTTAYFSATLRGPATQPS
jgi:type II secretory pathway pseudopilin PulG